MLRREAIIGDRFITNNDVTLFHGDCLELLETVPDRAVKLVVTSPPYQVGKSYELPMSFSEYLTQQDEIIAECVRALAVGGSLCWQVGHHVNGHGQVMPLDIALHPLFARHKSLRLRNRIIWHFEHGLNCERRFSGRHETILWYTKGDRYRFDLDAVRVPQKYPGKRAYKGPNRGGYSCNPLGKNPSDVWILPNVKSNHVEKTVHPCQFPIELPERFILALTRKSELVLDPFLGVGTTAVAAVLHGRRVVGADLERAYLRIARARVLDAFAGRVARRPFGRPVYSPPPNTSLTRVPFRNRRASYLTSAL